MVEQWTFNPLVLGSNPRRPTLGPHRLVRPRTPDFHSGNTGSNPVGDVRSAEEDLALAGFFMSAF